MKKILLLALAALALSAPAHGATMLDRYCQLYVYSDTTAKTGTLLDSYTATYIASAAAGSGARGSRGSYNLAPWDTVVTAAYPAQGMNAAYSMFTAADTIGLKLVKMQVSENKTTWTDITTSAALTGIVQVSTTSIGGSMVPGVQTGWVAGVSATSPAAGIPPPSPWYWCRLMIATRGVVTGFNAKFATVKDNNQ